MVGTSSIQISKNFRLQSCMSTLPHHVFVAVGTVTQMDHLIGFLAVHLFPSEKKGTLPVN